MTWSRPHGLVDRARDGVLLAVFRRIRPCEHATRVPAVRVDDSGLPRRHCSYVTETGIRLVQTVQKTVEIPLCSSLARLVSSRCCATIGAGFRQCCPVELPQLQFINSRRHSSCGAEVSLGCKLRENRRLSTGAVFSSFSGVSSSHR